MLNTNLFKWIEYGFQDPNIKGYYTLDNGNQVWAWKDIFIELSQLEDMKKIAFQKTHSILRGVWQYATPKRSEYKIGDLIMDFDSENNIELAKSDCFGFISDICDFYDINPVYVESGFSGSKGFYARFPHQLFLKMPIPHINDVYAQFIEKYKEKYNSIDMSMFTPIRLWRLPNSLHASKMLWRINLSLDEINSLSIPEIKEMAKEPRCKYTPTIDLINGKFMNHQLWLDINRAGKARKVVLEKESKSEDYVNTMRSQAKQKYPTKEAFVLPNDPNKILEILSYNPRYRDIVNGVPEKYSNPKFRGRNGALCKIVGASKKMGCDRMMIEDIALIFNDRCSPPKDRKEVLKVVKYLLH